MLHTPTSMFSELAAKCAAEEIERQTSVLQAGIDNHKEFAQLLNEVAGNFEKTGIGRLPYTNWYWCGYRERSRFSWEAYINRVAKALKRPYVYVTRHSPQIIIIEKKAYTRPLYAHLLVVAIDGENQPWQVKNAANVYYEQTGSRIEFHFNNDFGKKLYDDWMKQAKFDPEFRKALRLPENNNN